MSGEPVWRPDPASADRSAITRFSRAAERRHAVELPDYDSLWAWSTQHPEQFWADVWAWFDVGADGADPPGPVLTSTSMPGATWFPDVRLNYAEVALRDRDPDAVALLAVAEHGDGADGASQPTDRLTWGELRRQVAALAGTLRSLGVGVGDRVVGYLPNTATPVIALLAAASLGAVWSCCAPDYAAPAAANRLAQLEPVVLIASDGAWFGGKAMDRRDELAALVALLPTVGAVVYAPNLGLPGPPLDVPVTAWTDATAAVDAPFEPVPVAFDHPLWVLYSSGTTGVPKGLVHGHGGVVLDGLKTYGLHFDLAAGDRLFWYTTTNWMMWNFNTSALLAGLSIVVYDGSPTAPAADRLWQVAAEQHVTLLGVSPGYLRACERAGVRLHDVDLSALAVVGATGSPVPESASRWIADQLDGRVPLVSISGGTDIVGALACWSPTLPTWPGELSCRALGASVEAWDAQGRPVRDSVGELVVTSPMPTMPIYLWNDADGEKYRDAYFDTFPGVWRHGDWITIAERGSVAFHGRSDATLNRNGVRLGSADIYDIVERQPGIKDSLVVGIDRPDGSYWMPLFVVLDDDNVLDDALRATIASVLRNEASPRHVPDEIVAVPAVPRTRTGKKLEVPLKRILLGAEPSDVLSLGAVDDPGALDAFVQLARSLV